jgi:hypothetical protein
MRCTQDDDCVIALVHRPVSEPKQWRDGRKIANSAFAGCGGYRSHTTLPIKLQALASIPMEQVQGSATLASLGAPRLVGRKSDNLAVMSTQT